MRILSCAVVLVTLSACSYADDPISGHLVIIGGGLLPDNSAVYERLISHGGGSEQARFGILPIASAGIAGAERFARQLERHGISKQQIQIIDVTATNAERQTSNPVIVEQIRSCTGLFFTGGDQRRITRALLKSDGTETAALQAIRDVWRRGGVIAGSSAGAAALADPMMTVSGLPDDSLDAGMDALDFGRTSEASRRGVLVSRGLGFFRGGLIDQHFSQFRGRLGRVARVAIEERVRYGFGIDENTAMDVAADGTIEVVGAGHLTIVDADEAKCADGPLGCQIGDVRLTCLASGDRFDPKSGVATVHQAKTPIVEGAEDFNGNHPIPDIAGPQAVLRALIEGLANNSSRKQVGFTLKFNQNYCHGYRFTFWETDQSRSYAGEVHGVFSYAVVGVKLKIEPVVMPLQPAYTVQAIDLPEGPSRKSIEALLFRGILLADDHHRFRPNDPISRADLANAIVHTIHLEPPRKNPPKITDVDPESSGMDEILLVVAAGLMETDAQHAFRGADPVTKEEAATTLVRLAKMWGTKQLALGPLKLADESLVSPARREAVFAAVQAGLLTVDEDHFRPNDVLTRQQAATAIYRIIGFPW